MKRASTSETTLSTVEAGEESDSADTPLQNTTKYPIRAYDASNVVSLHMQGICSDFYSNGLPWKGSECRSILAGGSGIFYALPTLVPCSTLDAAAWTTQAILSVLADYVFIDRDHFVHGIDRCFATTMLVSTIVRAGVQLRWFTPLFSTIPLSFYLLANMAKSRLDLECWCYCHFGWHISGGLVAMWIIYLLNNCPLSDTSPLNWPCIRNDE